jgi:hypothetical protein
MRTALVGVLALVVAAGATGLLGVRSGTDTASAGGWTLSVTSARVARAGLDVPWKVDVHRDGGFAGPVTLAVTADYFDIFESQGLDPEPASETSDGDRLYWTFDPPPGDRLSIDFDAYIQPSSQLGASGEVAVLVDGAPVVTVPFRTWLVP